MNCEQFKQAYQKFDGADNVIHWRDWQTQEYGTYSDHMQDCQACRDWFQSRQLESWKVDPSGYPCLHMAYQANYQCASHSDPWDCPSIMVAYVEQYDEYGLPLKDGGESYWKIDHCPWCGIQLPESKRDLWIKKLKALGFNPFADFDRIPSEYKSAKWYRNGGNSHLRLV